MADGRITELEGALNAALAALVATTSLLVEAEHQGVRPSQAVASDAMFTQMLKDYDAATIRARAALANN